MTPEPELVIPYKVRDLLEGIRRDLNDRFDELSTKLDDRATVGMFRALQSDVQAWQARVTALEDAADERAARTQGVHAVLNWLMRFGGWLVATALGVAWLWLAVKGG